MVDLAALAAAVEAGDRTTATAVTSDALAEGVEPRAILDAMTGAMEVVGGRFLDLGREWGDGGAADGEDGGRGRQRVTAPCAPATPGAGRPR